MRIDQLKYLTVLAESSSIIEASEKLHLSHQVLGSFLKKAEEEFGMEIFKRSKKGIKVTKKGEEVIGFAYETLQKYNNICGNEKEKKQNSIVLYITLIYAVSVLPHIMRRFSDASLQLYNFDIGSIVQKINQSGAKGNSVGLISFRQDAAAEMMELFAKNNLAYRELFTSEICYFVRKDSKFAGKASLTVEEIPAKQLVMLRNCQETSQVDVWFNAEQYGDCTDSFNIWLEHILREDSIGMLYDVALAEHSSLNKYLPALKVIRSGEPIVGKFGIIYAQDTAESTKDFVEEIAKIIMEMKA